MVAANSKRAESRETTTSFHSHLTHSHLASHVASCTEVLPTRSLWQLGTTEVPEVGHWLVMQASIVYDIYVIGTVLSALRSTEIELAGFVRVAVSYR